MKNGFFAILIGAVSACILLYGWSNLPFIPINSYDHSPVFNDKDKQDFFATFKATFDAGNPNAEWLDMTTDTRTDVNVLKKHYITFEGAMKKITPLTCPTVRVIVPTRWTQNEEGMDRTFIMFDAENCKTEIKRN
jgi:hypothetical protein